MRRLYAVLVAPSRYDERGVVVFRWGISPNGALGALAGLCEDFNRRHRGDSTIDYEFFDEHVREAVTRSVLRRWQRQACARQQRLVLMLCGVQTVTYPRARDIALMARREGIDVLAGGVHLSAHAPSVEFLRSCGVGVAIGEVEPIWDTIVEDALSGSVQKRYRIGPEQGLRVKSAQSYMTAPELTAIPFPHIPRAQRRHYVNPAQLFIDSSRGCPFLCTFCVVKNVFGRTVRSRDPRRVVDWMVERVRRDGVDAFSFTDDNFVRSPRCAELLDRIGAARRDGHRFTISLILDVESTCYAGEDSVRGERSRRFLERCRDAGVAHVYMGLESTDDAVLREMRKGVNRDRSEIHANPANVDAQAASRRLVRRYRAAVDAWHQIGASVECGCIIGADADRKGVGARTAKDLLRIGADVATFFLLTALPGSEDFAKAVRRKTLVGRDFNEYFTHRPTLTHPVLSAVELENELQTAVRAMWQWPDVLRRIAGGVLGIGRPRAITPWIYFKRQIGYKMMLMAGSFSYVEGGLWRRPDRSTCRQAIDDRAAAALYLSETREMPEDGVLRSAIVGGARPTDDSTMHSLPVVSVSAADPGIP